MMVKGKKVATFQTFRKSNQHLCRFENSGRCVIEAGQVTRWSNSKENDAFILI